MGAQLFFRNLSSRTVAVLSLGFLIGLSVLVHPHLASAAAGACTAPSTDYGNVTGLTQNITSGGTYRIWTRMAAADTTNNTYLLEIDGSSCYTIGGSSVPTYAAGATTYFASGSTNWISKTSAGVQVDVPLTAGTHTFKLIGNAPNVVVDRLVMTQDTACLPTGTGDNCANPPDTTAPVANITAPAQNAVIAANTTASVTASDDVLVSRVDFYVDGIKVSSDSTGSPAYTYTLNPTTLGVGTHTLYAVAYDSSNNSGQSQTVTFTVPTPADTTPPTGVAVTAPTAGSTVSGTISLAATASDTVGVTKVDFYVDGATTAIATDTTSPYSGSYSTTGLSNASHVFTVKAYDAAGNTTTSAGVTVTVNNPVTPPPDTTPPTISITHPSSAEVMSGSYLVSATAADTSGIKQVQFYVDNVLKATDTSTPYTFSLDTTTLSNANHLFKAVATDNSTNQNTATSAVITAAVQNVTYLPADINQDTKVDIQDFGLLKAKFNQTGSFSVLGRADINADGIVDIRDFGVLRSQFGQ